MPTYRNDGPEEITVEETDGRVEFNKTLKPGEQAETWRYYDNPDLTKLSDSPMYNRVVGRQTVTLSATPQDVPISLNADWVLIYAITGAVTAYRQSADNTPAEYAAHTDDDPKIQIPAKATFDKLVVSGSGTCEVVQYRNAI